MYIRGCFRYQPMKKTGEPHSLPNDRPRRKEQTHVAKWNY